MTVLKRLEKHLEGKGFYEGIENIFSPQFINHIKSLDEKYSKSKNKDIKKFIWDNCVEKINPNLVKKDYKDLEECILIEGESGITITELKTEFNNNNKQINRELDKLVKEGKIVKIVGHRALLIHRNRYVGGNKMSTYYVHKTYVSK